MRAQFSCYTFVACCLFKIVSSEYRIKNATSPSNSTNISDTKSILANHRMNSQEVPKTNPTKSTNEVNASLLGPSSLDFPFNVDFVDQPEMFEVGQSFFLPTITSPSGGPVSRSRGSNRSLDGRWSKPLEVSELSSQMSPHQHVADSTSSPASRYIVFDDDNDDSWTGSRAAVGSLYNESRVVSEATSETPKLKQLKLDLHRHEAEKRKLLTLLARRLDPQSQDESEENALWANTNDRFVPLPQSGGLIRGLVPANHVVKHPKLTSKLKQASRHGPSATNRNYIGATVKLAPAHTSKRDRIDSPQYSLPLYTAPTSALSDTDSPTRLHTVSHQQLNGAPFMPVKRAPTSIQLQPVEQQPPQGGELRQAVRDNFSSIDPNAFANLAGASDLTIAKIQKPYAELGVESGDLTQASVWQDLARNFQQFKEDQDDAPVNLGPYSHSLFANDALESAERGKPTANLAPYRNPKWYHQVPSFLNTREKAAYMANKDVRPVYLEDGYKLAHRVRYPNGFTDQEDVNILQPAQKYHDRRHYEGSEHLPSASKKVIHIHTKEKKGHGKYLWPILGGGLTMLMGFLIISNMLLSIPLLAMGASSLFGHSGFHTQQLVPVYNLSQLRPPTGRRRKRWLDGSNERLDLTPVAANSITLHDFSFRNMLRRILTSLAVRGNRCRAHF